jgi:hypothetical protein
VKPPWLHRLDRLGLSCGEGTRTPRFKSSKLCNVDRWGLLFPSRGLVLLGLLICACLLVPYEHILCGYRQAPPAQRVEVHVGDLWSWTEIHRTTTSWRSALVALDYARIVAPPGMAKQIHNSFISQNGWTSSSAREIVKRFSLHVSTTEASTSRVVERRRFKLPVRDDWGSNSVICVTSC